MTTKSTPTITTASSDQMAAIRAKLRADADDVRAALAQLRTDESAALERCSDKLRTSMETMQADLDEAKARLHDERARSAQELRDEIQDVIDTLHGGLDELRVQLHLAGMDAAGAMEAVRSRGLEAIDLGFAALTRARDALTRRG